MLPILCYHKVGPIDLEGRALNVEPARLDTHVRYFKRRGLQFVRAGELAELWPPRAVCLTFDDAYHSALTFGRDVLLRHRATATFYAVPSLVGKTSAWDGPRAKPLASWDLLLEAQKQGFEIGNHTWSHADLSKSALEGQAEEWRRGDQALLEHGLAPESFCYPFGRMNAHSIEAARSAGAKVAVAILKRPARATDDKLALPRVVVAYSDSVAKLLYKLHIRPLLP